MTIATALIASPTVACPPANPAMTATAALLAFTLAAAILTVTPGLDNALVLRTAAVEGGRRALLAGLGISTGCLAWGAAAAFGSDRCWPCPPSPTTCAHRRGRLSVLPGRATAVEHLARTPPGRPGRRLRAAGGGTVRPSASGGAGWFMRGCLTNALNPKIGVFYVTFLPQFIPAGADVMRFSLLLAAVHAVLGMLWFGLLVAATRPLARWLSRPAVMRGLDRMTGAVFIAFGLKLALEKR